jgi:acyl-CoA thioester hydrolase
MRKKSTKNKAIPHLSCTAEAFVMIHEADPLGIVWHGNYLKYFELGRETFGRTFGIQYNEILEAGFTTPIVQLHCNYKQALKYGEKFSVKTTMLYCQGAKIILDYQIFNTKNELCCEAETTQVFINLQSELMLIAPSFYEEWKRKHNFDLE